MDELTFCRRAKALVRECVRGWYEKTMGLPTLMKVVDTDRFSWIGCNETEYLPGKNKEEKEDRMEHMQDIPERLYFGKEQYYFQPLTPTACLIFARHDPRRAAAGDFSRAVRRGAPPHLPYPHVQSHPRRTAAARVPAGISRRQRDGSDRAAEPGALPAGAGRKIRRHRGDAPDRAQHRALLCDGTVPEISCEEPGTARRGCGAGTSSRRWRGGCDSTTACKPAFGPVFLCPFSEAVY